MKKKKTQKKDKVKKLKEETLQGIIAIILFVFAVFLLLSAFGYGGVAGDKIYNVLGNKLFGIGYYLLPVTLFIFGYSSLKEFKQNFVMIKVVSSLVLFLSGLGIIDSIFTGRGGVVGGIVSTPLLKFFDLYISIIFLVALLLISLLVIFDMQIKLSSLLFWRKEYNEPDEEDDEYDEEYEDEEYEEYEEDEDESEEEEVVKKKKKGILAKDDFEKDINMQSGFLSRKALAYFGKKAVLPPLSLLEKDKGRPGVGDIKANSNIIKRTLKNFGINVEMDEISIGPSVTRYALKPAEGVKLSKIVALQNDLSLALAAHPLRIEAPIPGKSLVGIEIPNSSRTIVGLATLFSSKTYQNSENLLTMALGKDITGKAHFVNLAKAPHILIAGATGAGKSVTIHTLITSFLFRATPNDLKFIMIDPKRVELTQYKNIPHLLTPVVTDAKKAILALKWAVKEMDRRYDILESKSVRDIQSYHKNIVKPAYEKATKNKNVDADNLPETMPYIVIVIDELADIMQTFPRELEAVIVRLAQMSRAVGIHLILSTQRPSVNVITGLIKANVPTRIALQVASQVDSRTILDMAGAEKLLGAGDMLYLSGDMAKPTRIQSAFISEIELKKTVKFLTDTYQDEIPEEIDISSAEQDKNPLFDSLSSDREDGQADEPLYEDAKETIIAAGKASTSYLQRKLRIGYARAARIIDMLEEDGIIGPGEGSKPREVIAEQVEEDEEYEEEITNNEYLESDDDEEYGEKEDEEEEDEREKN
ncbi:MAG: DNA translocase FtsK [Patescibacteria group bacterium]|nr:DNA translocase FtsK [Patescibacteria group bacterium]